MPSEQSPLPGQCVCEQWGKDGCDKYAPSFFPSSIPAGDPTLSYGGERVTNDVQCDVWSWYEPLYQSVITVDVSAKSDLPALVRLVAARVQTDYLDIVPGVPADEHFDKFC